MKNLLILVAAALPIACCFWPIDEMRVSSTATTTGEEEVQEAELQDGRGRHHGSRRRKAPAKAPAKHITTYHLIQPKYTGLANKDAGDFKGDEDFLFGTFGNRKGNPEADIANNVFEMSSVTVKVWSTNYQKCNAPGCTAGRETSCPESSHDYCCESHGKQLKATVKTPPGYAHHKDGGYWFSFPKASEGTMWTEKVQRRIKGACLAEAWRAKAGGCSDCGKALDQCVAKCIKSNVSSTELQKIWDRAFKDKTLCPDQPFPRLESSTNASKLARQDDAKDGGWSRRRQSPSGNPPPKNVTVYHLFQTKFTGLANKDGGDFNGDEAFLFMTFNPFEKGNPEADITDNVFEMSTVVVKDWSTDYSRCNAPGCTGLHTCPDSSADYCCIGKDGRASKMTPNTLPGYESRNGGYWFSFPKASEGNMWTEAIKRRIKGSCLAEAWRSQAGGCSECGKALDQCVAKCIQSNVDASKLRDVWNKAFQNESLCPDQPFPKATNTIIV